MNPCLDISHDTGLGPLELREAIEQLASDWIACFGPEPTADVESEAWRARCPRW
jgi:hypothetical protein